MHGDIWRLKPLVWVELFRLNSAQPGCRCSDPQSSWARNHPAAFMATSRSSSEKTTEGLTVTVYVHHASIGGWIKLESNFGTTILLLKHSP